MGLRRLTGVETRAARRRGTTSPSCRGSRDDAMAIARCLQLGEESEEVPTNQDDHCRRTAAREVGAMATVRMMPAATRTPVPADSICARLEIDHCQPCEGSTVRDAQTHHRDEIPQADLRDGTAELGTPIAGGGCHGQCAHRAIDGSSAALMAARRPGSRPMRCGTRCSRPGGIPHRGGAPRRTRRLRHRSRGTCSGAAANAHASGRGTGAHW